MITFAALLNYQPNSNYLSHTMAMCQSSLYKYQELKQPHEFNRPLRWSGTHRSAELAVFRCERLLSCSECVGWVPSQVVLCRVHRGNFECRSSLL